MKYLRSHIGTLALLAASSLFAQTPNIVVILVDDMGYGDLGSYNASAKTSTPRLDQLAAEGMRFTDFHTNSAVCTPTRYGLLTGRYAWRTELKDGVLNGTSRRLISAERETIGKMLKRKNYRTASIGKWHLGMTETAGQAAIYQNSSDAQRQLGTNDVGFDFWYGIPASLDHTPYTIVSDGAFVDMTDDSVSPDFTTWGIQPASASPRFIRSGKIAPGFDFEKLMGRLEVKVTDYIADHVENHSSEPFFIYHPLPAPHAPWVPDIDTTGMTPEEIYIAYINQIDAHCGVIIDRLEDPNGDGNTADSIADDTLVVFTSDNGADSKKFNEATSGHDINGSWRGQKADIFEGGHRVPFLIKWPGQIAAGSVTAEAACMTDLFATFADIVDQDYDVEAGADSFSLKKLILGEPFTSPIRGPIVHHSQTGMFAIREAKWKLIFGIGSGGFSAAAGEGTNTKTDDIPQRLYDLEENPGEVLAENQLSIEVAVVADLHAKLDAIRDNPRSAPHIDLEDGDLDGLSNGFEDLYGLDKNDPSDAAGDLDADGLTNLHEFQLGTDPTNTDSDGDRLLDGLEDANQNGVIESGESHPAMADSDGDGLDDLVEMAFGTDFGDPLSGPAFFQSRTGECLILDWFEDGDIATATSGENGGVTIVNNTVAANHSLVELDDLLVINTGTGSSGNVGAATLSALDFAGSPNGIRLTWEVESLSARPQSNGLFLGFARGTGFFRNSDNLGLVFYGKPQTGSETGFSLVHNDRDSPAGIILDAGAEVNLDSLLDGFTASLSITPDSYHYELTGLNDPTGLETVFTGAGLWSESGLPADYYSSLGADLRLLTSVQRSSAALTLNLNQIKAEELGGSEIDLIGSFTRVTGEPLVALLWNSIPGGFYVIEGSMDLENWEVLETGVSASGSLTSYLHDNDLPRYFYRVREE